MDQVSVQVRFSIVGEDGVEFRDALYLPLDVYFTTSPNALQAMKQARYDAWKALNESQSQLEGEPEEVVEGGE